jgi:tripartite-type tricarboxylate transporter receptor subunit TctC
MKTISTAMRHATLGALAASTLFAAGAAFAEDKYPSRPIEIIVTFGPGGGADSMGRKMSQLLEPQLKVPLPVSNIGGASGNAGLTKVLTNPADGYTLGTLIALSVSSWAAGLGTAKPEDFTVIAVTQNSPSMMFVPMDSPFKTFKDMLAHAKANPGALKVATSGYGTQDDITLMYFAKQGYKMTNVPFAKPAERYASPLGKHTDAIYEEPGDVAQFLAGKQLRPLVVFDDEKHSAFPDVPTSKETGLQHQRPAQLPHPFRSRQDTQGSRSRAGDGSQGGHGHAGVEEVLRRDLHLRRQALHARGSPDLRQGLLRQYAELPEGYEGAQVGSGRRRKLESHAMFFNFGHWLRGVFALSIGFSVIVLGHYIVDDPEMVRGMARGLATPLTWPTWMLGCMGLCAIGWAIEEGWKAFHCRRSPARRRRHSSSATSALKRKPPRRRCCPSSWACCIGTGLCVCHSLAGLHGVDGGLPSCLVPHRRRAQAGPAARRDADRHRNTALRVRQAGADAPRQGRGRLRRIHHFAVPPDGHLLTGY